MRCDEYILELRREFPALRFVDKPADRLSHFVDLALRVVTLNSQRHYLTSYVTTLGQAIYLPGGWRQWDDASRYITLRHEAVHLRQFRRLGFLLMALVYTLPLLPLGLAWGRARLEWEAYAETMRATAEVHGMAAVGAPEFQQGIVDQFTSGAYGWMWPFPWQIRHWIDAEIQTILLSANLPSC